MSGYTPKLPGAIGAFQQIGKLKLPNKKKDFANTISNPSATAPKSNFFQNNPSPLVQTNQPVSQPKQPSATNQPSVQTNKFTNTPTTTPQVQQFAQSLMQGGGVPVQPKQPTAKSKYMEFLESSFDPNIAKQAQQNINDLTTRIAEENKRAREEQAMLQRNEAGMLERGQLFEMGQAENRASQSLADLTSARATQQDVLNQMLEAGASYEEALAAQQEADNKLLSFEEAQSLQVPYGTTIGQVREMGLTPQQSREAFELGEGQARYEYNPQTGQYEIIAQRGKTFAPGSGGGFVGDVVSPAAQALALQIRTGQATLANVPSALRAEVAQALNQLPSPQVTELDNVIDIIDELSNNPALGNILGPTGQFVGGVFGQAATAKNLYKQLDSILALEGRSKLKGSGAISDFEFRVLKDAQSALGRNLSEEEFRKQLQKVRTVLENRRNSISTGFGTQQTSRSQILVSPDGQQFDASDLTPQELQEALNDGYQLM